MVGGCFSAGQNTTVCDEKARIDALSCVLVAVEQRRKNAFASDALNTFESCSHA